MVGFTASSHHFEGKLWVVVICRWLWVVVDHCGLVVAGRGSLWVVEGHS